ncbi:MAG: hypothetical protein WAQ98_02640 [Blastocatellia bacterium]
MDNVTISMSDELDLQDSEDPQDLNEADENIDEPINIMEFGNSESASQEQPNIDTNTDIDTNTNLTTSFIVYTLEEHKAFDNRLDLGQVSAEELKDTFERAVSSENSIKTELRKLKVVDLKKRLRGYFCRSEKKEYLVSQAYDKILLVFLVSDSFTYEPFVESYVNALRRHVLTVTDEQIQRESKKILERREFLKKALTNPQTKEELETFVRYRGEGRLSSEQKVKWDEIRGIANIEKQEEQIAQKAIVTKVSLDDVDFKLEEHYHTKRGHNVFTVTISEKVSKEAFEELCKKARMLQGNYTRAWRDQTSGKVSPSGFTFNQKEQAEKFIALKEGNVSRLEQVQEHKEEVREAAVERLQEIAENLSEKAQETLTRERKINTERRARMAKGVESDARKDLQLAGTISRIANSIKSGETKFLSKIRNKTHIETLETILNRAKYERRTQLGERYEEIKYSEPELADIEFVNYPYPTLDLHHLCKVEAKCLSGIRLITNRFTKLFTTKDRQLGYLVIKDSWLVKDLQKIINRIKKVDCYLADMMTERLSGYQRLQLIGLTDTPTLRAALREYLPLRVDTPKVNPIKEMERELIGCKIDSYFPTPVNIVEQMLDLADISSDKLSILEPEAGKGNIADLIKTYYPNNKLEVIEINSRLRAILSAKGYQIVGYNFLEHKQSYDRIIMNPPFEDFQDIKHVKHAYSLLNEGGKLVAIMSESPFFRMDKEAVAFRNWLAEVNGSSEKLPQGSFLDSERSTSVSTRIVVIDKPFPDNIESVDSSVELNTNSNVEPNVEEVTNTAPLQHTDSNQVSSERRRDGILTVEEYEEIKSDFLQHQENYSSIMMRPILDNGQDLEHVYHAYNILNPGGHLTTVAPSSLFSSPNKISANFRKWLKSVDASTKESYDGIYLILITKNTLF